MMARGDQEKEPAEDVENVLILSEDEDNTDERNIEREKVRQKN